MSSRNTKYKITFINHEDGISIREEVGSWVTTLISWSVVQPQIQREGEGEGKEKQSVTGECSYVLEEGFSVRGCRLIWWVSMVFQDHHLCTCRLMEILEAVAAAVEKGIRRVKID